MKKQISDDWADPSVKPRYKLSRSLRARHVTMISLGGIIGAGLFVGSSVALANVGPAAVLSYLIAGSIVLFVMRMLCEMAVAVPTVGSFTEYPSLGLGSWSGFVCGWLYCYFWVMVIGVEVVVGAMMLQEWISAPVWLIGLAILTFMTAINLMSVRHYGEFEFWFASIKVGAIIGFLVVGAAYVFGIGRPDGLVWNNLTGHGGFAPFGTLGIFAGIPLVIFSICGAEIAAIAAAESDNPTKNVTQATQTVIIRILMFYVGSVFLLVCIVPWNEIQVGKSPFVAALNQMNVPWAPQILNFIILTAVLSCLNSGIYVTSRVLVGMASRGDAPAALAVLDSKQVPRPAVLAGSAGGFLAVVASIASPKGAFAFLLSASGAVMLFIYAFLAAAQIRLRARLERERPDLLKIKMWLFPWLSYTVLAAIGAILISMALTPAVASQIYASLASLAVVLIAFFLKSRLGSRRVLRDVEAEDVPER